jgi:FkbM family methyltransferase
MLVCGALAYSRHSPFSLGKSRLQEYLDKAIDKQTKVAKTSDGFLMRLDTSDFIQRTIYITGTWDDDVARIVRSLQAGDLFVDCGANVGFFSLLAATRGAEVIAFEPNPACHSKIMENSKLNGTNIDARMLALSNRKGAADLHIERSDNVGGGTLRSVSGEALGIFLDTLDSQLNGRVPTLVKIDVEGAEIELLEGARHMLESGPRIVLEVSEFSLTQLGGSKDRLFELMSDYGYQADIVSKVRRSKSSKSSVYFQYDVLFSKTNAAR